MPFFNSTDTQRLQDRQAQWELKTYGITLEDVRKKRCARFKYLMEHRLGVSVPDNVHCYSEGVEDSGGFYIEFYLSAISVADICGELMATRGDGRPIVAYSAQQVKRELYGI